METTSQDFQIAALAAGFSLGYGVLTVWEAIKQTRRNRNPLRSVYIYMIWGELLANISIGVLGWLFLQGIFGPTVPVLFFILFSWVLQIQFLMQIIINRIALIAEHRGTVRKIKYGTAILITLVNLSVFCIWIPAHLSPPASPLYVKLNNVWDKIEKVVILLVDAGLNYYFLRIVKLRLVEQHRLTKYSPLVAFNAKLMILSISMDGLLIGLMFLRNPVVYVMFHPVVYLVKLNIEMSMASLITHVAKGGSKNDMYPEHHFDSSSGPRSKGTGTNPRFDLQSAQHTAFAERGNTFQLASFNAKGGRDTVSRADNASLEDAEGGIHCRTDLNVVIENVSSDDTSDIDQKRRSSSRSSNEAPTSQFGDEIPLRKVGVIQATP
ncbi:unnamed protein product [Periconia digitata]|uniref:Uncharacterized protein n=1 Tax=Periconia digitata TaxID=1303443 RepID=A0A9W4XVF9_9PLEO|nr:unnamed protein product [Periconia digitata]